MQNLKLPACCIIPTPFLTLVSLVTLQDKESTPVPTSPPEPQVSLQPRSLPYTPPAHKTITTIVTTCTYFYIISYNSLTPSSHMF